MGWWLRPSVLIAVSTVLAGSALALVLWPRSPADVALPLPAGPHEREIVWLYTATNPAPWERFVTAISNSVQRLEGGLPWHLDASNAFPAQSTATPEVVLVRPGKPDSLRIRWYKLTSDLKTRDWVAALTARKPPPLAILGGGSSDLALDLAHALQAEVEARQLAATAPLLFLTMATADEELGTADRSLHDIYPGRTFRFCFTNRQMAHAVVQFVWSRNDLRPDADPAYLTFWRDDPYSMDLSRRFVDALRIPAAMGAARDWAALAGQAVFGGKALDLGMLTSSQFRLDTTSASVIPYAVGTFDRPNRWEMEEAGHLMRVKLEQHPGQRRPLLVLPAASQPARRFLRALVRTAPAEARRFVAVTGDAISFNLVYRDRNFAWPIQDLPFPLVFFCHRDPVSAAVGFPLAAASRIGEATEQATAAAGTEDLLLYMDIVDTLLQACCLENGLAPDAQSLRQQLSQARWKRGTDRVVFGTDDRALFDAQGERASGTGEHVVLLRPISQGRTVLPEAGLEVWGWQAAEGTEPRSWVPRAMLTTRYEGSMVQESVP